MSKMHLPVLFAVVSLLTLPWPAQAQNAASVDATRMEVDHDVQHDVSPPLRSITSPAYVHTFREKPLHLIPRGQTLHKNDPVVQSSASTNVATTAGLNFAGVGNGDYGFAPNAAPPDTNGAVGATQYVQWVNESFAVFNKTTGAKVQGPTPGNAIWSGFGGGCETNNDGDAVVAYDKAANRWVLTQFSVATTPYLQCVAVSTTSDATGSYYRYAFQQPDFNDYPKLGVWPDGYYVSYNMFHRNTFVGGRACAMDRNAMLAGSAATQVCFQTGNAYGGLLPSDLDGSTPPPAGASNVFASFGNDSVSMDLWRFHVDYVTPGNSTFSRVNIPAPAFSAACGGGGTCIPQAGTTQKLDSLADRLMHRLAYRNFGDHESLVVNHAVTAGSSVGVRWYEIRDPRGTASVYQSGTYAPDSRYRWMGSAAMDRAGNIALGYSISSSTQSPAIGYTGRAPGDPLGTMQAENAILSGGGSQTFSLSRWGDYSAMTIDPTDDCTFFFTTEYLKSSGSFNWSTWISSFKFDGCGGGTAQTLTTITVSPASASVPVGGTQQFTATGYDQNGAPMSPQPAFSWQVSGGGTINSGSGLFTAAVTAGGPFTVTATSGGVHGTASVSVTSLPPDFTLSVTPSIRSVKRGGSTTYTVTVTSANGFSNPVNLSLSVQPSGPTGLFSPNPTPASLQPTASTLTMSTSATTKPRTYTLTITGTGGSLTHMTTTSLTVANK